MPAKTDTAYDISKCPRDREVPGEAGASSSMQISSEAEEGPAPGSFTLEGMI